MVPIACLIFEWSSYTDFGEHPHFDSPAFILILIGISTVTFFPFTLRHYQQRRIERTLLGVRFNGVDREAGCRAYRNKQLISNEKRLLVLPFDR